MNSEASAELAPEDLLAHPSLWRRLVMLLLIGVVAAPIVPPVLILAWLSLYLAVTLAERAIVGRRGYIGRDLPSIFVTFALSALHAWAAAELIHVGDPGSRLFAVALIGFSGVNILLRLYGSPRMFLAAIAPHAAVLGWVSWGMFAAYLQHGAWLKALTPPAILILYVVLLLPTRRRLAEAWGRLMRAKAAAEAASLAKSRFLATMSHEVRTPLNGVIGLAEAMQNEPLSPAQAERARLIRRSGETLLGVFSDALDLSAIEADLLSIETVEFDVEHVTRGVVATFAPLAAGKGLTFDFRIEASAKGRFRGDASRIRQILHNLVSNAVKFTEDGGVGVRVSAAGDALQLEVTDTGAGISADRMETLFAPFVQADASPTRRHGGAGLGLSICKAVAERMGGEIGVKSTEGRGSVFTVALPIERLDPLADVAATATDLSALRVLAAEDNPVNQLVLKTLLAQAGLEPTVVANGVEALEAWRGGPWDLVLMDIQMPVMDGVAATRAIRDAEAAGGRPRTPIIALTANAMSHQVPEYETAGVDLVVAKPLDAASLFAAINRALASSAGPAASAVAA